MFKALWQRITGTHPNCWRQRAIYSERRHWATSLDRPSTAIVTMGVALIFGLRHLFVGGLEGLGVTFQATLFGALIGYVFGVAATGDMLFAVMRFYFMFSWFITIPFLLWLFGIWHFV